ncbi:MAG: CDP-alcohol phosphatidyltransferase family protein [Vicinamibacterales bacterium]
MQRRTLNVYDTYFTRRVSIYVTSAIARLSVTPNQVSAVGVLVGAVSCALIAFGSPPWVLFGVGLLHLYAVLDSVDGELARMTQQFSLVGLFIEDLSAYVMINAFNLSVAWRLYVDAQLAWPLVAAVGIAAFGRNVMPVARRAVLKSLMTQRPRKNPEGVDVGRAPSPIREFLHENVVHITNHWVVISALLGLWAYGLIPTTVVAAAFGLSLASFGAREVAALIMFVRRDRLERELSRIYAAASRSADSDPHRLVDYQAL